MERSSSDTRREYMISYLAYLVSKKMLLNTCNTVACFTKTLRKVAKLRGNLCIRQLSITKDMTRQIEEQKIMVDGVDINYARVGTGNHPVLLLPGSLDVSGTIWTDFKPQIEHFDIDKLTIVIWDPPGYGKSRPPDRDFPDDFFQRDAAWAHNLMKILGYDRFSLIGWSGGGTTSLVMASAYPESIQKMVVLSANADIYPDEVKSFEILRDINILSERMRLPMIQAYGEDYFKKTWSDLIDAIQRLYEKQNGDLCRQALSKIKCPTLIIHGAKDTMILPEHSKYLKQKIANSRLHIFEKGAHNLHLRYPDEFNSLVTDFLTEQ